MQNHKVALGNGLPNWPKRLLVLGVLIAGISSCGRQDPAEPPKESAPAPPSAETAQGTDPQPGRSVIPRWTGDLDGMIQRRVIRVLVPYSKTQNIIDEGEQRGIAYEVRQEVRRGPQHPAEDW